MQKKLESLINELKSIFPERREVIVGMLVAILIGEHVLILGPPGTAKSSLVRLFAQAFGARYWEKLLTKFTVMEEVWGPVSLTALQQDRFNRVTTGRLAEADLAFIDEVGRANSSVLNSLLSAMVERLFHNDAIPTPIPLISMFGATNSLPEGQELEALWDRFILKYSVDYLLRPSNLRQVLTAPDPALSTRLTLADLKAAQAEVSKVKVTDDTIDAMLSIRDAARADGIVASDRRWKKSVKLVQATAFLAGGNATCPEDLSILADSLWREPKERSKVARIVGKLADPIGIQATEILDAARETAAKVAGLQSGDRKEYISQAAHSLQTFQQQQNKLSELARSAGQRSQEAIKDAISEVKGLHAELARAVSTGLGLGMRSVK